MRRLWRLLIAIGINAVIIWGVGWEGWSGATALTVYWFENLFGSILVAVRIAIHRWLTRKRGHFRAQLGVTTTGPKGGFDSFLSEFLAGSLAFTLGHGVFLG